MHCVFSLLSSSSQSNFSFHALYYQTHARKETPLGDPDLHKSNDHGTQRCFHSYAIWLQLLPAPLVKTRWRLRPRVALIQVHPRANRVEHPTTPLVMATVHLKTVLSKRPAGFHLRPVFRNYGGNLCKGGMIHEVHAGGVVHGGHGG
jgi:hypothetical protein